VRPYFGPVSKPLMRRRWQINFGIFNLAAAELALAAGLAFFLSPPPGRQAPHTGVQAGTRHPLRTKAAPRPVPPKQGTERLSLAPSPANPPVPRLLLGQKNQCVIVVRFARAGGKWGLWLLC